MRAVAETPRFLLGGLGSREADRSLIEFKRDSNKE